MSEILWLFISAFTFYWTSLYLLYLFLEGLSVLTLNQWTITWPPLFPLFRRNNFIRSYLIAPKLTNTTAKGFSPLDYRHWNDRLLHLHRTCHSWQKLKLNRIQPRNAHISLGWSWRLMSHLLGLSYFLQSADVTSSLFSRSSASFIVLVASSWACNHYIESLSHGLLFRGNHT